jgi:hypothetical protein
VTKRASRPLINRLLSGREGLSAPDKEEVLAAVLSHAAPKRAWWSTPWFRGVALAGAFASVALAIVWVRPADEFTPRGAPATSFDLSCLSNGVAGPCRDGSTVAFRVETPAPVFFSALTVTDGETRWYFHDVETRGGVLERAPVLSGQPAGAVVVIGVFAPAPLDKAALRERLERGDTSLTVVRRTLVVQP